MPSLPPAPAGQAGFFMLHSPVIISCSSHQLIITSGGLHLII